MKKEDIGKFVIEKILPMSSYSEIIIANDSVEGDERFSVTVRFE